MGMLDLKTVMVALVSSTTIQGLIWIAVWLTWRSAREARSLAAGFGCIALGVAMMSMRGESPPAIELIADNFVLKLGVVALITALAQFLRQPYPRWLGPTLLGAYTVGYATALKLAPEDFSWRLHLTTLFCLILVLPLCAKLARDREHPAILRWITIGVTMEYVLASLIHSGLAFTTYLRDQPQPAIANNNAWFFLQANLFTTGLFASFLFMIMGRLSGELMQKNQELSAEIVRRRQLEKDLATSLNAETMAREEQKQFLRMVSHEFRTPLAMIQRAAEMMGVLLEPVPAALGQRLSAIDEAVNRLMSLVERFVSADRDGNLSLRRQSIDMAALLAGARDQFIALGAKDRIHIDVAPGLPAYRGDPDMLQTVLINLIDNALKYSPPDRQVRIRAQEHRGALTITVADTGIGIPAGALNKVGQRFFRAPNTTSTAGTGLGLYNSRRLLAYHDANLMLENADSGGVMATVRLPLPEPAA